MKIDGIQAQGIYESYTAGTQSAGQKQNDSAKQTAPVDKLQLSSEAESLRQAGSAAKEYLSGDVAGEREARIQEIKNQIESGTYSVPSKDVAASILKGSLLNVKA